ncbi:(+)-neomenthol dehydrogenase-like [Trifolium medium]|uniref:(+)-neomenthol dehydrogenase-like n=1 Tax=Trifolium medium TaxID=97028 RepID=A0A392MCJ6_9FABA|nr:(+)-neomenthol dehydrogenase-like [Trifolium medium]
MCMLWKSINGTRRLNTLSGRLSTQGADSDTRVGSLRGLWIITLSLEQLHKVMPNGRPKEVLSDVENLTEEKIDEILSEFLNDYKDGSHETKGWPISNSGYIVSKVTLNAYTRVMAKKYPSFSINAISPGYVKTDMNHGNGALTSDEGAEPIVRLALLYYDSPSGLFFSRGEEKSF